MPYRGDSPLEAWKFWFDVPPSRAVLANLEHLAKDRPAALLVEAIEVTGQWLDITEDAAQLSYIAGILRRKALEAVAPERAEEERNIDVIRKYWDKTKIEARPLSRPMIANWLQYLTAEELKALMSVARSEQDLEEQIANSIEKRKQAAVDAIQPR
jgi:hypothetical protein